MKKISEEVRERVKMKLQTSMTGYEVAEECKVSVSFVNKIRKELEAEGFDIWHRPGVASRWVKC